MWLYFWSRFQAPLICRESSVLPSPLFFKEIISWKEINYQAENKHDTMLQQESRYSRRFDPTTLRLVVRSVIHYATAASSDASVRRTISSVCIKGPHLKKLSLLLHQLKWRTRSAVIGTSFFNVSWAAFHQLMRWYWVGLIWRRALGIKSIHEAINSNSLRNVWASHSSDRVMKFICFTMFEYLSSGGKIVPNLRSNTAPGYYPNCVGTMTDFSLLRISPTISNVSKY